MAASAVKVSGTSFTATVTGLKAQTTYQYRISVDGTAGEENSFTTAEEIALTNGSFDNWSQSEKTQSCGSLGVVVKTLLGYGKPRGDNGWR